MNEKCMVGLDCGNSSFRILLGKYDGEKITTQVISQVSHNMVKIGEYYYWDILRIFEQLKESLKKIAESNKIDSIGICTWGVDFAPFDKKGNMISNPLAYRNTLGEKELENLTDDKKKQLFDETGILCDKINSVYLLSALKKEMPEIYSVADKILMIPDIFNYFLTGVMQNEPSELSTTQIMSSKTKEISHNVCDILKIDKTLWSKIGEHGKIIGNITNSIMQEIGVDYQIPVVCVPSHDTACAVAAIPTTDKDFIFISSGTWSLIGTELQEPIISDEVYKTKLTNEVGAFNKITLLKNSSGLFIIQKIKREYDEYTNRQNSWDELDLLAEQYKDEIPLFDVNDSRFFNPIKMGYEIWKYLLETKQVSGEINWGAIIKTVHHSMACSYAITIKQIESVTKKNYDKIYIVGGGSKNIAVNELTAQRTGKTVVACNKESTALGNIAVQLSCFYSEFNLEKLREVISKSGVIKEYKQDKDDGILQRYEQLLIMGGKPSGKIHA